MLTTLRIKNLALVSDLTLEFKPGYNAITGETGAGKSILIGALNLILGQRADRGLIRSGTDSCTVEAVFEISGLRTPIRACLDENGIEPCEGDSLLVKRSFTTGGVNRQFINGSSTTLSVLTRLGERLVDIHGPHEHQSLLYPSKQLAILDAFAKLQPDVEEFRTLLDRLRDLRAQRDALMLDDQTLAQRLDHLRFQVQEIQQAAFRDDEEEGLVNEHGRASNSARLLEIAQGIRSALGEDESGLLARMPAIGRHFLDLKRIDGSAAAFFDQYNQIVELTSDLHRQISGYVERLELDPEQFRLLEDRLDLLHLLKRKYGKTIPEINAFAAVAALDLARLEERDIAVARISDEISVAWRKILKCGEALSNGRRLSLARLAKATIKHLKSLGFAQSQFEAQLKYQIPSDANSFADRSGFDLVEFLFSPNAGEPLRPLREIGSSGEIARVMLALKTVLAAEDDIPVLIFDEVDANVGGETASAVGEKMRQIGMQRQVLCITHLAPVAARANHHFFVDKRLVGDRTVSLVSELHAAKRIDELARMLGGKNDAARRHAESLLAVGESEVPTGPIPSGGASGCGA